MLLRGHVDNARVEEFRRKGGEAFVRTQALKAIELSKNRAGEIRKVLIERHSIDAEAHRHRRPRLGRARRPELGYEPPG